MTHVKRIFTRGTYIGPNEALQGKTAEVCFFPASRILTAQFDDTTTGHGYSWTAFAKEEFRLEEVRARSSE
jgi:hypothetical protein